MGGMNAQQVFLGLPPHIHAAIVTAYIKGALANGIPSEDLQSLIAPWLTDAGNTSFYRQFAQADERYTAEVEPLFHTVRCPVQILWGADDPWIPITRGQALHDLIPQSGFTALPGLGHLPQLEDPQTVLKHIQSALG
jgi:pimeloyl-ACP methyl ester carboxylesterase